MIVVIRAIVDVLGLGLLEELAAALVELVRLPLAVLQFAVGG